jgi:hypothetical protein
LRSAAPSPVLLNEKVSVPFADGSENAFEWIDRNRSAPRELA